MRHRALWVIGFGAIANSCGGGATDVVTQAIAIAVSQSTLTLAQGAATGNTITITLTRSGGFTDAVNLAFASNPAGVTGAFNPTSLATGVTSTTLTITVPSGQAPGSYTLTITGSSAGVTNAVTTITLTVTQGGVEVGYAFCGAGTIPVWLAVQDGTGPFTVVPGVNDSYTFRLYSGRGAVAWVRQTTSGGFAVTIQFGLTAELQALGSSQCIPVAQVKTLNGSFAGAGATDIASVGMGTPSRTVNGNAPFTFTTVPLGPIDLIATLAPNNLVPPFNVTLAKMIIRRATDYPANSTIPVLDFLATSSAAGSASAMVQEWFVPQQRTLSITGANAGNISTQIAYVTGTGNGSFGTKKTMQLESGVSTTTRSFPIVPLAMQSAQDLHEIIVVQTGTGGAANRTVTTWLKEPPSPTVVNLPAANPAPTVSTPATAPYLLTRLQYDTQAEADDNIAFAASQGSGASARSVSVSFTGGYRGLSQGSAAIALDWTLPIFGSSLGFQNTWMMAPGPSTWSLVATGSTNPTQFLNGVTSYLFVYSGSF